MPSKTQDTDVVCDTASCDASQKGKKLYGYSTPITTFVGRYADNVKQEWWFYPFDTARTKWMWFDATHNRIYTVLGSALFAYDMDTFFSRLAGGEKMTQVGGISGISVQPNGSERVLNDDRFFYPEQIWGSRGGDGEGRLFRLDWDDRGYMYLPAASVGWGIARDDFGKGGGEMANVYTSTAIEATVCMSVKTSDGTYYALVGDISTINIFDVTNPASPQGGPSAFTAFSDFAKSSDGTRIAVFKNGTIRIYNADTIARGGSPIWQNNGGYANVSTDGTNFFAATLNSNYNPVITVISPNATGSYTTTSHTFPGIKSDGMQTAPIYTNPGAGGYITMTTKEGAYSGSNNVRLFKLLNLVPTEVTLNGYVARHYGKFAQGTGYTNPGTFSEVWESHVLKRGSKYYFIIADYALGDVYELKGADSITARLKSSGKTANGNSKQAASSGPYYGDEITFTSEYSGTTAPSVTWSFGDSVQQTVTPGTAGAPDVAHQYGGLTAASLPATMTVNAVNAADASMNHAINVTLARPAPRVGILGTSFLFTQATSDLTLPIVSSDVFYDGSDGAVEGHYSEWKLATDTVSTKTLPNGTFSVGAIGERTLTYTGHYGPYTANFTGTADAAFTISPIAYKVRAFAPVVNGPLASGANVLFKNATRVTTRTSDLAGGAGTAVDYTWELLDKNGAVVTTTGNPVTGRGAISAIPDFSLPRAAFNGADNDKVRLTVKQDTVTETALTIPLNGPTPGPITVTGCANIGSPCSLTTPSAVPGNDPATWTYNWTITDGPITVPGGTSSTFSPVFPQAGTYTVSVTVSNALGDATPASKVITLGAPLCSSNPSAATTSVNYHGRSSGCIDPFTNCNTNETIDFSFSVLGWTPGSCDKYSWNFGDNTAASTEKSPSHTYTTAGTYTVTLFIDGGIADATIQRQIKVGTTTPPPPPPPPPTGCGVMAAGANVSASYTGSTSGCSPLNTLSCTSGEIVAFRLSSLGYNFGCGVHSVTYKWGDNTPDVTTSDTSATVNHTYAAAGTYAVVVSVTNPTPQTIDIFRNVTVVADGPRISCGDMTPGLNIFFNYNGPASGCNASNGTCGTSENIAFTTGVLGYNLGCATHTYLWNFGDGGQSTEQNPAHAYTAGGDYAITLKITRADGAVANLSRTVKVAGANNCPPMVAGTNIIMVFAGTKSHCTGTTPCQEDEDISFGMVGAYDFGCSTHSFEWNFGDGSPVATTQYPSHTYDSPGDYNVTLKITNSKQQLTMTQKIVAAPTGTRRRSTRH